MRAFINPFRALPARRSRSRSLTRTAFSAALLVPLAAGLVGLATPGQRADAQILTPQQRAQAHMLAEAARKKPSKWQAWTQVPEYNVRFEVTFNKQFRQIWEWHYSTHDFDMNMRSTAVGKIKFQHSNGRYWVWNGTLDVEGEYAMDENWYSPDDTLGVITERASGPDHHGDGMYFTLVLDTETGTYEVQNTDLVMKGTVHAVHKDSSSTREAYMHVPCAAPKDAPLPGPKPPLIFRDTIQHDAPPMWRIADPYVADMNVDLSITPVGPKPEFLLKPIPPTWMPEPGKTLPVTVVPKKPNQNPAPIRFILEEITQEPGTCLNSPDTNTNPDLEFDPSGPFDAPEASGPNSFVMETRDYVNGATANVVARDYGAWGKVRAEAQIDGQWEPIPVERSTQGFLTVPLDNNANKISDDWEKKNKAAGKAATWDQELFPTLNNTAGDGFSLYEEYRGLLSEGAHRRLDPATKELAVQNLAGGQVKPGIALFGAASKLKVLTLSESELKADRVVNANSAFAKTRNQHGLRLKNAQLANGDLGGALPIDKPNKRPADCIEVQIDVAQILASPAPTPAQAELDNTVAHELGHGIGASHHGEAGAPLIDRFLTSAHVAPAHIAYQSNGKELTDRPYEIKGKLGGIGSLASGDESCIMCYNSYYQWAVQRSAQGQYRYYGQQYRKPGTRFCTSNKGTGVNSPKNKPASYFGDAERGNCLGQLCPKDQ